MFVLPNCFKNCKNITFFGVFGTFDNMLTNYVEGSRRQVAFFFTLPWTTVFATYVQTWCDQRLFSW